MNTAATKQRLSSEARKEQIIASVLPLFAQKGFLGTTTKEMAAVAGISEALLYKHFPSKAVIYDYIQEHCCVNNEETAQMLSKLNPSTKTLVTIVYFMASMIIKGHEENADTTKRLMLRSLGEDGEFARMFLESRMLKWFPTIQKSVSESMKAGDIKPSINKKMPRIWLIHHLSVAIGFFRLPQEQVVDYHVLADDLVLEVVYFVLRGMGMKEEVIEESLDIKTLETLISKNKGDSK